MEYKIRNNKSRRRRNPKTRSRRRNPKTRRNPKSRRRRNHAKNMRGGANEVKAVFTNYDSPIPGNPAEVIQDLHANAKFQNNLTKSLAGGSRRKKYIKKGNQSGGGATICSTSLINSADGYGYVPPIGCIPVPTVSNLNAQALAIDSVHISATGQENAKYDNLIGKKM